MHEIVPALDNVVTIPIRIRLLFDFVQKIYDYSALSILVTYAFYFCYKLRMKHNII